MSRAPRFQGRTIQVVRDLSSDEQLYFYRKARELKQAVIQKQDIDRFRLKSEDLSVYLFFMEDSTRTKESFRNAAKFHDVRLNDFVSEHSSFNKKESITDTIKMLFGYSMQSIFILRTRLEGVCRWLEFALNEYADKIGYPRPSFINGGDGRHEHPTQEFLDEFSFLEHYDWKREYIHIALVGDLFHGRTVHSKPEGLKVFKEVEVDLIAPEELSMPSHYIEEMKQNGYHVRRFSSIDEYLKQQKKAPIWYFTRLQIERMGEKLLDKADMLRQSVTFRKDHMDLLADNTRFFHPLPRHRVTPVVPMFLDRTPLNGWDEQSMNGYFTRIIEIGLLGGILGEDFEGEPRRTPDFPDDFVEEVAAESKKKPEYKIGIKQVETGIVIDHIGKGQTGREIWDHINKIRKILNLNCISSHGVYSSYGKNIHKGIISLPDIHQFNERQIKMLGAIAPECTLNIIKNAKVLRKYRIHTPPRIYNFEEISCRNDDCISNPEHHEHVVPEFTRSGNSTFICKYCDTPHNFQEIWREELP